MKSAVCSLDRHKVCEPGVPHGTGPALRWASDFPQYLHKGQLFGEIYFLLGQEPLGMVSPKNPAFVRQSFPIPPQVTGQKAGVCTQLSKGTDHDVSLALLLEGIDLALE